MAMAATESNKARKRRLDQGFNLRFAPPEDEKIWNPLVCIEDDKFWKSCGLSKSKTDQTSKQDAARFLSTDKLQLLRSACNETDRAMLVDGLKKKLIKDCDSKYPSMGYERWLMSAQEYLRACQEEGEEEEGEGNEKEASSRGTHCQHKELRDPLIPCFGEGAASINYIDQSLVADIVKAGTPATKATSITAKLSKSSTLACKNMKQLMYENEKCYGTSSSSSSTSWIMSKVDGKHEVTLTLKHNRIQNHANIGSLFNICLASETLNKLQILYNRAMERGGMKVSGSKKGSENKKEMKDNFHSSVYTMLTRYETLSAPGYQASLPGKTFDVLRESFGVEMECFASPLNTYYERYCSAFPDTDTCFGSLGSFFDFCPTRGSYEVNPPFSPSLMLRAFKHVEKLLLKAQKKYMKLVSKNSSSVDMFESDDVTFVSEDKETGSKGKRHKGDDSGSNNNNDISKKKETVPIKGSKSGSKYALSFIMIVPVWEDSEVWPLLMASSFLRGHVAVKKEEHAWRECAPKITSKLCGKAARRVPCDTALFILQTPEAAARWPCSSESLAAIRTSLTLDEP